MSSASVHSTAANSGTTISTTTSPGSVVFDPAGTAYHSFRIPALLAIPMNYDQTGTAAPTLLAFCEGRVESVGDSGPIELVLRRSTDGGTHWEPLQVVCRAEEKTCGNPVPILDPASGDVVLLSTRNGARVGEPELSTGQVSAEDARRVYLQRSSDQGRTWSPAREITADVRPAGWGWYATGPCHGIALQYGDHPGRLIAPANHTLIPPDPDTITTPELGPHSGGHCIISDDGGHSWRVGFVADYPGNERNPNETTVAELADGRVIFNARNHGGTAGARLQAISIDGGESLATPYTPCPGVTAPGIQGSLLSLDGHTLLLGTPASPDTRTNLTIFLGDGDNRWRAGVVITPGPAGYCDLAAVDQDRIGLLYETGSQSSTEQIRFHLLRRAQLTNTDQ